MSQEQEMIERFSAENTKLRARVKDLEAELGRVRRSHATALELLTPPTPKAAKSRR